MGVDGHREAPLVGGDQSSLDPVPWSSVEGVCFRSWMSTSDSWSCCLPVVGVRWTYSTLGG